MPYRPLVSEEYAARDGWDVDYFTFRLRPR
jgi:hypothetical protein